MVKRTMAALLMAALLPSPAFADSFSIKRAADEALAKMAAKARTQQISNDQAEWQVKRDRAEHDKKQSLVITGIGGGASFAGLLMLSSQSGGTIAVGANALAIGAGVAVWGLLKRARASATLEDLDKEGRLKGYKQ